MNAMTGNYLPAQMKASDSDRDAVVADLGEHFQAGRLTAGEFDERAPADRSLSARPWRSSGRFALPPIAVLAGLGIAVAVLVNVAHVSWGFIWLLLPGLLVARRLICYAGAPGRSGQETGWGWPWGRDGSPS